MKRKIVFKNLMFLGVIGSLSFFQFCQKEDVQQNNSALQDQSVIKFNTNTVPGQDYVKYFPALKSSHMDVVTNGGFEAGFSGWNVSAIGHGINGDLSKAWIVGASDPNATNFVIYYGNMPHSEDLAHSGLAGASAVENGSTYHRLSQDVTLPMGQVELSFWIRWKSQAAWTYSGNGQNMTVTLKDVNTNTVLTTLFDAKASGLPLFSGGGNINHADYENRSYDISAFAGQTVRLEFKFDVQYYFLYVDLDDISIVQVSYPAQLEIMPDKVNLKSKGTLPVALLSDSEFDATTMDLATISLGNDDGNDTPLNMKKNGTYQASFEDVDGDGLMDLMMHFDIQALIANGDLSAATTELKFNGHTEGGLHVIGADTIIVK